MEVKYPNVHVQLTGEAGNAFFILGKTQKALQRAKVPKEEVAAFIKEATNGDYNHLLQAVMRWVEVD